MNIGCAERRQVLEKFQSKRARLRRFFESALDSKASRFEIFSASRRRSA
jgi:hypothetical protein